MSKIISTIAIIVAIVAILLAGWSVYIEKEGPTGPIGMVGEQGIQGPIGPVGPQGLPGENGTDGKDGERGPRGYTGDDGPKGEPGEDAPINKLPVVTMISMEGTYEYIPCCWHRYTFPILVNVTDPDGDNMEINFFYRFNETHRWILSMDYMGTDGDYKAEEQFTYKHIDGTRTIFWRVQTWDGSDIGLDYFESKIEPIIPI